MRWPRRRPAKPSWYRCEDRSRPNDVRMLWHYQDCELCAAAARLLGRDDVVDVIRDRRAGR